MQPVEDRALAERLIAEGFLDGLDEAEVEELGASLRQDVLSFVNHPWRVVPVDEESLGEGQAPEFLEELAPALARLGVPPCPGELVETDDGYYVIKLPGHVVTLMTQFELDLMEWDRFASLSWALVPARLYRAVNRHIEHAGKPDRLYCLGSGNDGFVLLLTPPMFDILRSLPVGQSARPYVTTERWPHFGEPN